MLFEEFKNLQLFRIKNLLICIPKYLENSVKVDDIHKLLVY